MRRFCLLLIPFAGLAVQCIPFAGVIQGIGVRTDSGDIVGYKLRNEIGRMVSFGFLMGVSRYCGMRKEPGETGYSDFTRDNCTDIMGPAAYPFAIGAGYLASRQVSLIDHAYYSDTGSCPGYAIMGVQTMFSLPDPTKNSQGGPPDYSEPIKRLETAALIASMVAVPVCSEDKSASLGSRSLVTSF